MTAFRLHQWNWKALVWIGWFVCSMTAHGQIDNNANGISDIWEIAYGTTTTSSDPDGDGQSNLKESVAGTNPNVATSIFSPKSFQLLPGNIARLIWPTVPGKKYQVQVATEMGQWKDVLGSFTGDGSDTTVDLPLDTTFLTGKIPDSNWSLIAGEGLNKIKANATNNVPPTALANLTSLALPPTSPNVDYFGHWVRGWIIPPTTGIYQFWIASDDSSELWLSTNSSTTNKSRIAYVSGWTNYLQWDKYASQISATIILTANVPYYFEAFQAEGSGGDHLAVAWSGPGIASKTILSGKYVAASSQSLGQLQVSAPSMFFRVSASDMDTDGDGISDADEMLVGYNPGSTTTTPRINDAAALRSALSAPNIVTVGSPQARAFETPITPGRITFFRSGNIGPLTIAYIVTGSAISNVDYLPLSGSVYLPVGLNSVSVDVTPRMDNVIETAETVTVQVAPSANYTIGNPASAIVTIDDAPDILYVANLRPDTSVQSGGYGTASLNVAGNLVFGNASVSLGNLTSPQVRTELYISTNGLSGNSVLTLPTGQIGSMRWNFNPAGGFTQTEILNALAEGRLYARVISNTFASGEIFGRFVAVQGWQTMPIPPTPPVISNSAPTTLEAARFLAQITYGPTRATIDNLVSLGSYQAWLNQQFALAPSLHLPYVQARRIELLARDANNDGWQRPLQEAWWENTLRAPDQLRQRMAFALSQIFVISQVGALDGAHEGVAHYYDLLVNHAFGNFRTLLKNVTLSPMMGTYLSMIRNQKPNPTTGAEPDENYAREVMQLFTIGLSQLHPDGSLKLSNTGMPIPTYNQADIVGLAHVFTGWSYPTPSGQTPNFLYGPDDDFSPMAPYENYHDTAEKRILNNTVIPAGQTTAQDLDQAIDALFNHPNVGPFIARQLIQKFITSNPSPGYIFRVSNIFNNNGSGVRGDLQATLQAVLLDYEARSTNLLTGQAFGKQREPIIRMAHLLRAVGIKPPLPTDNRYFIDLKYELTFQAPLHSPSVFNFFQPNYIPPGPLALAGVYGPEFQITSDTTTIDQLNIQRGALFWGIYTPEPLAPDNYSKAYFDFASYLTILNRAGFTAAENQQALLDELNLVLLNGRMTTSLKNQITEAYAELPSWYSPADAENQRNRIRMAIYLILASPEYVIQK